MGLVPKYMCGFSMDEVLAYQTRKVVQIEDRNLGCVYYIFVLLIAGWVLGFQILYGNEHFQLFDVKGTARMTIQQPTEGCNPNHNDCKDAYRAFSALPYCKEFDGDKDSIPPNTVQQDCKFADQHEMAPTGMLDNRMFIPTRIDSHLQVEACAPSSANRFSCDKSYKTVKQTENVYIADVENFTVMFVHNYYRGSIMGNSLYHQGYFIQCTDKETGKVIATKPCKGIKKKVPIDCLTHDCMYDRPDDELGKVVGLPSTSFALRGQQQRQLAMQHAQKQDHPFAIGSGDIFKLSKLLELAGLDLDAKLNQHKEPYREAGTVVEVEVEYSNLHPIISTFGYTDVGYVYRVIERPMEEMKTEVYSPKQPEDYPKHRSIENRHGIMLIVTVSGTFGYFNVVYLLVMLTTSLALLAGATSLVDMLAMYVLERRNEYRDFKYKIVA